ncbi:hypothetical protein N7451_008529 [Penicillium sp. IBT 35674x]|nr:hypothetical protein N7451_008529 [Penicillium sp. IBT 35674x]
MSANSSTDSLSAAPFAFSLPTDSSQMSEALEAWKKTPVIPPSQGSTTLLCLCSKKMDSAETTPTPAGHGCSL